MKKKLKVSDVIWWLLMISLVLVFYYIGKLDGEKINNKINMEASYKQGQVDACNGIMKYKPIHVKESIKWVKIDEE